MSQVNETWASLTQDERDEMNEKDRKGRIKSLAMKYGRRRVDAAQKEVESDAKRTGRNTKKRPITWRELQGRIENTKNTLKPGEVRRWDKEKGKWVSNKEDVDEAVATAAATSPLWIPKLMTGIGAIGTIYQMTKKKNNQGPGLKDGSGTKPGGVWDKLPKGNQSKWNKGNNLTGIAKEVKKQQSKANLKKIIKDKYGNKDQLTGGTLPEHFNR